LHGLGCPFGLSELPPQLPVGLVRVAAPSEDMLWAAQKVYKMELCKVLKILSGVYSWNLSSLSLFISFKCNK